jgi:putative MFS transporter
VNTAISFHRPVAFWTGAAFVTLGVLAHIPDYLAAGDMHFHMAGMPMSGVMIAGMFLVAAGMVLATWGLLAPVPASAHRPVTYQLRAIDDAALTGAHWGLLFVLGVALIIDVMKPATLGFVIPGMSAEYGIKSSRTAWLLICALAGTTIGSVVWGILADRLGRRAAILLASLMFIGTSICGAMPSFAANLLMCFLMGLAAGGMLPIVYALMAESVPAKSRGWLVVLHGGMGTVGGTLAAAGFAALLEPTWSWRILWLMNLPTGIMMLILNRWIPESPRFLLDRGRIAEARAVMARYGVVIEIGPSSTTELQMRKPPLQWNEVRDSGRRRSSCSPMGWRGAWSTGASSRFCRHFSAPPASAPAPPRTCCSCLPSSPFRERCWWPTPTACGAAAEAWRCSRSHRLPVLSASRGWRRRLPATVSRLSRCWRFSTPPQAA